MPPSTNSRCVFCHNVQTRRLSASTQGRTCRARWDCAAPGWAVCCPGVRATCICARKYVCVCVCVRVSVYVCSCEGVRVVMIGCARGYLHVTWGARECVYVCGWKRVCVCASLWAREWEGRVGKLVHMLTRKGRQQISHYAPISSSTRSAKTREQSAYQHIVPHTPSVVQYAVWDVQAPKEIPNVGVMPLQYRVHAHHTGPVLVRHRVHRHVLCLGCVCVRVCVNIYLDVLSPMLRTRARTRTHTHTHTHRV